MICLFIKVHGNQQPVLHCRRAGEADREEEAGDGGQHQPHLHPVLQVRPSAVKTMHYIKLCELHI